MRSPNRHYLPEIDQLRGLAAILVFFYHSSHSARTAMGAIGWPAASDPFSALLWEGHSGVALFFVLSGYILASGALGKPIDYWQFMRNRALRIFPLMILVVMFSLYGTKDVDFGQIAASLFLFKNTSAAFNDPSELAGTVWTIAVEFQLYFIAPFLIAFTARRGILRFVLPMAVLFFALRMILLSGVMNQPSELFRISYFTGAGRANQFLVGVALAYLVQQSPSLSEKPIGFFMLIVGSCGALGWAWLVNAQGGISQFHPWHVFFPELEALVWVMFLAGVLATKPLGTGIIANAARYIGLLSFSTYLLHFAIQRQFWYTFYPTYFSDSIGGCAGAIIVNILLLSITLGLSQISWTVVEKPFLEMRKRYVSAQ